MKSVAVYHITSQPVQKHDEALSFGQNVVTCGNVNDPISSIQFVSIAVT